VSTSEKHLVRKREQNPGWSHLQDSGWFQIATSLNKMIGKARAGLLLTVGLGVTVLSPAWVWAQEGTIVPPRLRSDDRV